LDQSGATSDYATLVPPIMLDIINHMALNLLETSWFFYANDFINGCLARSQLFHICIF
jgi:hypothetical protein